MRKILTLLATLVAMQSSAQVLEEAKKIVDTLASPYMAGRGYVEDGNKRAAAYILNEYQKIGLKTLCKKSYAQELGFPVNTFPDEMEIAFDERKLKPGVDYIVEPSCPSVQGTYEIALIKKRELLDEKKVAQALKSAKNKWLLIDERAYVKDEKKDKQIEEVFKNIFYNDDIKTKGCLLITDKKLTWSIAPYQDKLARVTIKTDQDFTTVKKISIHVRAQLIPQVPTQNLVGYVPAQIATDTFIAIVGHYDHLGKMGAETYFPGANDNASGIAMQLELAKYFQAHPLQNYNVLFIAFTGEEIGLLGAKYFVENPCMPLAQIKFLLNFDLAGTGEEGIKIVNGSIYKDKFETMKNLNTENNLLPSVNTRGKACNSDHCMFDMKGVPCFFIYTQGGIQAYHDVYDKAETLPLTEFEDYYQLMIKFITSLDKK